jgi:transposase
MRYLTRTEHMPRAHQAHREWSPSRFLRWAADIGQNTRAVVAHQLEDRPHPEHGYRACLGILQLARRYDRVRLERACARAVALGTRRYQSIASILKQGLDSQPLSEPENHELPLHDNVRGPDYYH